MARDDRYIGQTYGPAGMGMNAYMDRPGPQRRPNVRNLGQTYGPAGMGMNAYMNRPEQQQGIPPSRRFDFKRRRDMPMPTPMPSPMQPPGMGPFRQQPFPDQMLRPKRREGLEQLMPDSPNLMERPILPRDFVPEFEPPILPRDFEVGPMQPAAAAVDPSDWRTILRILEAGGDPQTETAGIMGAMPEERQMAELTDDQRNFMRNRYFSPDLPGAPTQDELFRRVKDREDKGFFGFGAQEPTTREEFDDYYNYLLKGDSSNQPFYVT